MEQSSEANTRWLYFFIAVAVIVNLSGLFVTIITPDAALYASIAKTMVLKNNYIDLFVNGQDWLDKPHFPFWVSALSFKVFGIHTWSYKLPGILFVMMAAWYSYKFALSLYNRQIALWTVLILLTAQHLIISNNDVRAEPYLTGLIIASVYYFYKARDKRWFWNIFLAALFAACAVMTKGIFAAIPVAASIFGHLILKKEWKLLFDIRWLVGILLAFLFILPELWCLYVQFDIHPEKVVFGQTHVSGLKFFFWDSQFGRFFNDGPIKKSSGDPTFFLHTTLWAYLPWSLLLYTAIVQFFRSKSHKKEWYNLCGAGATFLIFSLSKFQLPHYITIIFPFFSILTAQYLLGLEINSFKWIKAVQTFVMSAMVLILGLLHFFFRPEVSFLAIIVFLACIVLFVFVSSQLKGRFMVIFQTCTIAFFVNFYFNLAYYPKLLTYQSDSMAAFYINAHNKQKLPLVQIKNGTSYALDFYAGQKVYPAFPGQKALLPAKPYLLFADQNEINELKQKGLVFRYIKTFDRYRITMVKKEFLNSATRSQTLESSALVLVK